MKQLSYQDVKVPPKYAIFIAFKQGEKNCIKVTQEKTKEAYFFSVVSGDVKKWKDHLKQLGAKEIQEQGNIYFKLFCLVNTKLFASITEADAPASKAARSKLEITDVEKWTREDVQEWLTYIRDSDGIRMHEKYGDMFKENDVDGKVLLSITDDQLKQMGIQSLGKRLRVMKEIEKVKQKRSMSF